MFKFYDRALTKRRHSGTKALLFRTQVRESGCLSTVAQKKKNRIVVHMSIDLNGLKETISITVIKTIVLNHFS